jgi:hypothetical protein
MFESDGLIRANVRASVAILLVEKQTAIDIDSPGLLVVSRGR